MFFRLVLFSGSGFILYMIVKRQNGQSNVRRIWICADITYLCVCSCSVAALQLCLYIFRTRALSYIACCLKMECEIKYVKQDSVVLYEKGVLPHDILLHRKMKEILSYRFGYR